MIIIILSVLLSAASSLLIVKWHLKQVNKWIDEFFARELGMVKKYVKEFSEDVKERLRK